MKNKKNVIKVRSELNLDMLLHFKGESHGDKRMRRENRRTLNKQAIRESESADW